MTISRAGEGGEAGASCLLPKQQSAGAPGQGRGGGGRATCPNCPNDNQPQRRGWRRATVWGGAGAAVGRCSTPRCCPALWQGCTGWGAAPPLSWRRQLPRTCYWSCTAGTWRWRALCMLDRVEGYGEQSSPAGGWRRGSGNAGGSDGVGSNNDNDDIGGTPTRAWRDGPASRWAPPTTNNGDSVLGCQTSSRSA